MTDLTFPCELPQDAKMPVKPMKDRDPRTGRRKVRIWLDAWLLPGESEKLLLMGEEATYHASLTRVEGQTYGKKAVDEKPTDGPDGSPDDAA